jgi:hypothetical protein
MKFKINSKSDYCLESDKKNAKKTFILKPNLFFLSVVERYFEIIDLFSHDMNSMYNSLNMKMKLEFYQTWVYHCSAGKGMHDTITFKISMGCAVIKSVL